MRPLRSQRSLTDLWVGVVVSSEDSPQKPMACGIPDNRAPHRTQGCHEDGASGDRAWRAGHALSSSAAFPHSGHLGERPPGFPKQRGVSREEGGVGSACSGAAMEAALGRGHTCPTDTAWPLSSPCPLRDLLWTGSSLRPEPPPRGENPCLPPPAASPSSKLGLLGFP